MKKNIFVLSLIGMFTLFSYISAATESTDLVEI